MEDNMKLEVQLDKKHLLFVVEKVPENYLRPLLN